MRWVRCDRCDYIKYGDEDQGIHKSTEQPAAKKCKRDIHFNDSMSNFQKVKIKYMYTDWLEPLQSSVP